MDLVETDWLSGPMRNVAGNLTRVKASVLDEPPSGSQSTADRSGEVNPRTACFERRLVVARRVLEAGRSAGLLVRDFSAYPRLDRCLRISIGTPEQNERLLAAVAQA